MSSPENLFKATINLLKERLSQKIIDVSSGIAEAAKNAPESIQREWDAFQEEVMTEASRIENESIYEKNSDSNMQSNKFDKDLQVKIDDLRDKVASINEKLEAQK